MEKYLNHPRKSQSLKVFTESFKLKIFAIIFKFSASEFIYGSGRYMYSLTQPLVCTYLNILHGAIMSKRITDSLVNSSFFLHPISCENKNFKNGHFFGTHLMAFR